jgi:predicted secreted protein
MFLRQFCWVFLCMTASAWAVAEPMQRVDFQTEVAREFANDLLTANLSVNYSDKQPARVAQHLTTVLNNALKTAGVFGVVKTSSGNQQIYPVYGNHNQIDTWRGEAQIHLESRDFKAAAELIAQLQSTLQLSGIQFSIAADTRRQLENNLMTEALDAFKQRADAVRSTLGGKSYQFVHLNIQQTGQAGYPQPMVMMARGAMVEAASVAPNFAAGSSQVGIQVSGTIELLP